MRIVAEETQARKASLRDAIFQSVIDEMAASGIEENLSKMIDDAVVSGLEDALSKQASVYANQIIGAARYERSNSRQAKRSGTRPRLVGTKFGQLCIRLVKTRGGVLVPPFLKNETRFRQDAAKIVRELWTRGLSTRSIAKVSEDALGKSVSHSKVSSWVRETTGEVLQWLNRPVRDDIKFLVLDGIFVPVKREVSKKEPILVAMGITESGEKELLAVLAAPSESKEAWKTLLLRLKANGLNEEQLRLIATDGGEGLISAVKEQFPNCRRQRCVVHKVRNVIGKTPRAMKKIIPKEASEIWKAPSREEAERRQKAFVAKYQEKYPKIAAIVVEDFEATLAFYDFDPARWQALRSTNVIERANRELRRKFRDIGSMKGEIAATRHAVAVAKMLNDDAKGCIVKGFQVKK